MMKSKALVAFDEVLKILDGFTNYERVSDYKTLPGVLGTERMEDLLDRLGSPHATIPALHIAGTKGKGSTAHLTARLLLARGFRVGLYTSPHLQTIRERIMVQGKCISKEAFCEAFARVQPAVDAMQDHPERKPPTYFEILTAMAFVAFSQARVDVVVIEVGLGGRLDATNVRDLPVVASAITPISKDHTAQLGEDLTRIAGEKAGIIRQDSVLILAPQEASVDVLLKQRAEEQKTRVQIVGQDIKVREAGPIVDLAPEAPQRLDFATWRAVHHDIPLPLLGFHQQANACTALGLVEAFLEQDGSGPLDTATIRRAWRDANVPGRLEIVQRTPWVLLDGAHNSASAWALTETLTDRFQEGRRVLVFAVNQDKEFATMLRILAPVMQKVILTTNTSPRCVDPEDLLPHIASPEAQVERDPIKAVARAVESAGPRGLVVVTGSLYLVGAVRGAFLSEANDWSAG